MSVAALCSWGPDMRKVTSHVEVDETLRLSTTHTDQVLVFTVVSHVGAAYSINAVYCYACYVVMFVC